MGMKLFGDDGDDSTDISKIEINKEFAHRYEHNKKREDLQRYEELKKQGRIVEFESDSESESESESESNEGGNDDSNATKKQDIKFFENLIKVRNRDPLLYQKVELFESESDGEEEKETGDKVKKKKPIYLKDVTAQHLIQEGPEFEEAELSKKNKTYNDEQEELKKAFLDAVKDAEVDGEGDFLKVKQKNDEEHGADEDDDSEFQKKLGEYFGQEGELDENNMFLKQFFMHKMWIDKEDNHGTNVVEDDVVDELWKDEDEIEKQEQYEENYNFRFQENAGDRVVGHSRKVEGSVRKKENARREQRKSKEERIKVTEMERKEELKHLKNLKKKEMKERMRKVMDAAGIKKDDDCPLDLDDLEEDFDPDEYDKMMKKAFDDKYYDAEDIDPDFGSDSDKEGDGKPEFNKEDELLGLPEGWDDVENTDGFLAARERFLKRKAENSNVNDDKEEEEEEADVEELIENGEGLEVIKEDRSEESKRKRKRKMSLVKKAREEMMEEYYQLDYEDTIGDLKTRFKYAKVNPNRYGMKTKEILMLDDKELNQYVSIKKLAPYREKEWKLPNNKRHQLKMNFKELKSNQQKTDKKKRSKDNNDKSSPVMGSEQNEKVDLEKSNVDLDNLSRGAKRRRRQQESKMSNERSKAYLKMQPKAKGK